MFTHTVFSIELMLRLLQDQNSRSNEVGKLVSLRSSLYKYNVVYEIIIIIIKKEPLIQKLKPKCSKALKYRRVTC